MNTPDIALLLERLLPEALERFLTRALGQGIPRLGEDGRYRVLSAGRFSGRIAADLLGHARNQEANAALVVVEEDVLRTLYFHGGLIVGADSNVLFERLGRILGQAAVLEEEDAVDLVEVEEQEGVAAAAARLPRDAVRWGLERRTWAIGCALYLMPRAHFLFVDGEPDLGDLPRFAIPPMELAVEGLRRYDEWRRRPATESPPESPPQPARRDPATETPARSEPRPGVIAGATDDDARRRRLPEEPVG